MANYKVHYEICDVTFRREGKLVKETVDSSMWVQADSENRALEHATGLLDQKYDGTLLVCEVVGEFEGE